MDSTPNLLFLYTDEQRFDTMAAYGNSRIEMPNLNSFAETATVFDEAYVTQPVCTPSRSSLLTGMYPHTNGCTANNVPLRSGTPCLAELLVRGEYATAHYGKWHLGDEIFPQHGFQQWRGIEDMYRKHYSPGLPRDALSHYQKFLIEEKGLRPDNGDYLNRHEVVKLAEEYCKPQYLAREATSFLRENRDRPFCLFVNFLEPHMPFFSPRDDQYDPSEIPLPANIEAVPTDAQSLRTRLCQEKWSKVYPDEADWRALIARYWGLCSLVDTYVGRILDTLSECDLAKNTIVVFTSDHGDMMASHRMAGKCVLYQESVRVPLLVRLPGQHRCQHVAGPISQVDLVPTLLELMGQPVADHLEGTSRAEACEGHTDQLTDDVFIEWNGPDGVPPAATVPGLTDEQVRQYSMDATRTIITADGWRFTCSPMGQHELYDLNTDRGETNNLATQDAMQRRMRLLRQRIIAWQRQTGDNVTLP